ncbi:MAG TPA: M36 family metallopeptidase [Flavobacteriales bacterium]|nr:M36 family metallopeptidase [Flavobacteriales bacterium]HQV38799.1 M36 family metallopeptidase [Flavobacteriales bacterium]HQW30930.1 M36 family metallopeptidase [Flavobacteriales bacterium]HQY02672.1 M36 family metallopeptidase [Flavobacteriales bacterium]HQY79247.1 M36 family metallopeptidase [Flavobacteriales bacterium]
MRFSFHLLLLAALSFFTSPTKAQERSKEPSELVRARLVDNGYKADDLADLLVKDHYRDAHNGVEHTFLRQRWHGIEVFNGDIAVHQAADGRVIAMNNGAWAFCGKTAEAPEPMISAEQALANVLRKDLPSATVPSLVSSEDGGQKLVYDGTAFSGEPVNVQLMYLPSDKTLRLVWNVNYYQPGGAHWWSVRISANTGEELDRNDWVSQCGFDEIMNKRAHDEAPAPPMMPAAPNDYNVYPAPLESPNHGSRAIRNAPWTAAGIASPYGWHDTNGSAGAEYTITRGNNVLAQEDANGNDGTGYSPDGGATLDFDFPINLSQEPVNYQDAALTNLFYWNNMMHDVWYQYGFDDVSGNFQENNYGRGGAGGDYVLADGQDGIGTNNANFGTPPDGSKPRMQMFLWNSTSPKRDGDLDNGVIAHEYGHGISNRLVGGPSNVNCLNNAEQMGEGWSDFFGLMMTMEPGDARTDARGIGTYVIGEPVTGLGIRPAPYSTSFGVNSFTYADTEDPSYQYSHAIGFIWCTMLWEMTWDLVDQYGFDPDLYNGTGGNNIAMQLVIDGLKLTACSPGFVDGRDAILQADALNNGGANQSLIWSAFARRGLGYGASQGSSNNLNDQTEAYNLPLQNDIGIAQVLTPGAGDFFTCGSTPVTVSAQLRNFGILPQSGFTVRYSLDGAPFVSQAYSGTLAAGATETFTFTQPVLLTSTGAHTLTVGTVLSGDEYPGDDEASNALNGVVGTTVAAPLSEDVEGGSATPAGWTLQNPDNATTWTTATLADGADCSSTTAWAINNYSYNSSGQEDRLVTPMIDLSGSSNNHLTFDHAYARYSSSYYDAFRVDVSMDCGNSWNNLYNASGSALATAADNTSSTWVPADCSEWASHDLDLSAYDGEVILLRFVNINGYGQHLYFDNVNVSGTAGASVSVRMYLDGCYNTTEHRMDDQLRTNSLLPATEPYSVLGFTLTGGGGETAGSGLLAATGDDAIVDWVIVELRSSGTPGQIVEAHCALLQRDGDVVAADGGSALHFAAPVGDYYIAVRHRNHLGCMSATTRTLSATPTLVDFSLSSTATYGTDARRTRDGKLLLWSGNVVRDGALRYTGTGNDRDPILTTIGQSVPSATTTGYEPSDVNLDGVVKYTGSNNDRDAILQSIGGATPTDARTEQLP